MKKQTRVVLFAALTWGVIVPVYTALFDPPNTSSLGAVVQGPSWQFDEILTVMFLPSIVLLALYFIYDKFVR